MKSALEDTAQEDPTCETLTPSSSCDASGSPCSESLTEVMEKIRRCREVPADGDMERLAYLAGQEVISADESGANDPAWDDAKVQELRSIVLEHHPRLLFHLDIGQ